MPERRPDWLPVARWELTRIVRRWDFVLSVVLTPALMFVVALFMGRLEPRGPVTVAVARVDSSGAVVARAGDALPARTGFRWVDPGAAGADTMALAAAVRAKTIEAALVLRPTGARGAPIADLVTRRGSPRWARDLQAFLAAQARRERAAAYGLPPDRVAALEDSVTLRHHAALGARSGGRRADFVLTFAALVLMVTVITISITYMMVGISGEKSARVTEVVISAIPAQAWMDGKILALTGVGLLVGLVWTGALFLMAGSLAFALPGTVSLANLAVTAAFTLLGLYLYNALMAALMATAQSLQAASKWQGNFIILPFIPLFFMAGLIENPDSAAMVVLSQVPFFAPVMVPTRLVLGAIQAWEIALAAALLIASCALMRVVAGRVFRLGMLMYGKDVTLPELIRWARVK